MSNSSCNSLNVVYVLTCIRCSCFYIGQSNNLKNRISCHLSTIRTNKTTSNCKVVKDHFNLDNHDMNKDFRFFVFKTDIEDLLTRLNIESHLIHLFESLQMKLLNESKPNVFNYNKQTYLFK